MRVLQAVGPFIANQRINFNIPQSSDIKYIKLGVQAPQSPFILAPRIFPNDNIRFKIQNFNFIINSNDILEFEDFNNSNIFTIIPLQNMDAYTIIDVAFINEKDA